MFTFVFNCLGCIARMFTSYAEGGGLVMIRGFALGLRLPTRCLARPVSMSGRVPITGLSVFLQGFC